MANDSIDPIDLLDEDIFSLLKLKDVSPEERAKLEENMLQTIQNRVLTRILDKLTDDEIKAYEDLLQKGNDDEIMNFLKTKNIDLNKITVEEAILYKSQLIAMLEEKAKPEMATAANPGSKQVIASDQ